MPFSKIQSPSLISPPNPYLRLGTAGVKAGLDPEVTANFLGCTASTTQVDLGPLQWGQCLGRDQDLEVRSRTAYIHGHHWNRRAESETLGLQSEPLPQSLLEGQQT